jgi:hypothetical protein
MKNGTKVEFFTNSPFSVYLSDRRLHTFESAKVTAD